MMADNDLLADGGLASADAESPPTEETTTAALARRIDEAMEQALLGILGYATELALAAAEAIVRRAAATDPRVLETSIREALQSVTDLVHVNLRVHPDDAPLARDLGGRLRHGPGVTVSPDEGVTRGGCLAVTDFGEVDATMESQLRRLAEALRA
jgi:flagellar assembly protein FliH